MSSLLLLLLLLFVPSLLLLLLFVPSLLLLLAGCAMVVASDAIVMAMSYRSTVTSCLLNSLPAGGEFGASGLPIAHPILILREVLPRGNDSTSVWRFTSHRAAPKEHSKERRQRLDLSVAHLRDPIIYKHSSRRRRRQCCALRSCWYAAAALLAELLVSAELRAEPQHDLSLGGALRHNMHVRLCVQTVRAQEGDDLLAVRVASDHVGTALGCEGSQLRVERMHAWHGSATALCGAQRAIKVEEEGHISRPPCAQRRDELPVALS